MFFTGLNGLRQSIISMLYGVLLLRHGPGKGVLSGSTLLFWAYDEMSDKGLVVGKSLLNDWNDWMSEWFNFFHPFQV